MSQPIFEPDNVRGAFARRSLMEKNAPMRAVNGVSVDLTRRRTLGVVGESGRGKSKMAKMMIPDRPTAGAIL